MSELRDVISEAAYVFGGGDWQESDIVADAVIRAIEASGRVTVDRARFERLLEAATWARAYDEAAGEPSFDLRDDDLEPLP